MTLVTRQGCHLCEPARATVARVAEATGCGWREVDVDSLAELRSRYGELVPVVLVDGAVHDCYRVDESRLRKALSGSSRSGWRRLLRGGA